jgi:trimethylamine:corrinoid methyltransferase-like protein
MLRFAELLTPKQMEGVHEASLEILESIEVSVHNDKVHARFVQHGCHVAAGSEVGGAFIDTRHTLEQATAMALLSQIADRSPRQQWEAKGALHFTRHWADSVPRNYV